MIDNIHCLVTGPLSVNTYIVQLDETCAFVIDAGGSASLICRFLEEKSLSLKALVLTHGHFDHIGALPELKKHFPDAKLYIHSEDSRYIGKSAQQTQIADFGAGGALLDIITQSASDMPEADALLADGEVLFADSVFFDGGFTVLHTSGHSAGSVCLYNNAQKVLFSGDTLFNGTYGRTDLPGGDVFSMMQSLRRLAELPQDTVVFPGHGESTVISSVQEILQY